MNCYNGEEFLREAISSVIAQTYENWELIFWDNHSTDGSARIFHEFSDIRLRYFLAPSHTLLYEARSMAMQKVSGDYIAFLDVDDWWTSDKLCKQIPLFKNKDVAVVYGNYWLKNERKKNTSIANKNKLPEGAILDDLLREYLVGILTIVMRRTVIENLNNCFDKQYQIIGDFDLMIRLSAKYQFACIQEPIAYYRWHGKNTSFLESYREIDELEHWIIKVCSDKRISSSKNFVYIKDRLNFCKVLNAISCGRRSDAWRLFCGCRWGLMKLKLLIMLTVPYAIVRKLRA